MSKTIQLTRQELVWQTRCNSWDEQDYLNYLDWLKGFKDSTTTWGKNNYAIYEVLKDYSWDEIIEIIEKSDYDNEPKVSFSGHDGEYWYSTHISDIIRDAIREDNYDCDVCCEDYADDYEEQWDTISDNKEEPTND